MTKLMRRLVWEDEGQDLIEYALLAAFIALAATAAMIALGGGINTLFTKVTTELSTAGS